MYLIKGMRYKIDMPLMLKRCWREPFIFLHAWQSLEWLHTEISATTLKFKHLCCLDSSELTLPLQVALAYLSRVENKNIWLFCSCFMYQSRRQTECMSNAALGSAEQTPPHASCLSCCKTDPVITVVISYPQTSNYVYQCTNSNHDKKKNTCLQ